MVGAGEIAKVRGGGGGKDRAGRGAQAAGCGLTKGAKRAEEAERGAAEEEDGEEGGGEGEEVRAFLVVCLIMLKKSDSDEMRQICPLIFCPVTDSPFLVPISFLHCFPLFFLLFLPCAR